MCSSGITTVSTRCLASGAALARAFGCARVVFNDGAARPAGGAHGRAAVPHRRGTVGPADRSQGHPGAGMACGCLGCRASAGAGGPEHGVPELLRLRHGQPEGPKVAPPRFRSRKDPRQAIRFTGNARFKVLASGQLRLPKIGDVPVRWSGICRPRRPA